MMDWKDALASLSGLPEGEPETSISPEPNDSTTRQLSDQKTPLHVLIEKKGRGGKTATIIEGFEISDEKIDEIASTLRKRLGTGGSARGGEILIQGERKADVVRLLKEMGLKVKG